MTVEEPDIRQAVAGTKNKAVDYNHNFGEINRYVTEKETENAGNIDSISTTVNNLGNKVNTDRTITITGFVSGEASFNLGTSNQITITVEPSTLFDLITPDYSSLITITAPTSSNKYTAPKAGIYIMWSMKTATNKVLYINDVAIQPYYYYDKDGDAEQEGKTIPLSAGDVIYWSGNIGGYHAFVPYKGA